MLGWLFHNFRLSKHVLPRFPGAFFLLVADNTGCLRVESCLSSVPGPSNFSCASLSATYHTFLHTL